MIHGRRHERHVVEDLSDHGKLRRYSGMHYQRHHWIALSTAEFDDDLSLHFDHGVENGSELIGGADGAWSKVCPLVSQSPAPLCRSRGHAFHHHQR